MAGVLSVHKFCIRHRKEGVRYREIIPCNNGIDKIYRDDIVSFYLGDDVTVQGVVKMIEGPNSSDLNVIIEDEEGILWCVEPIELTLVESKRKKKKD